MRIVSLLPAATEITVALGARSSLVGISHECDYPPEIADLPRVTATPVDTSQPGTSIDREVLRLREAGRPVIGVEIEQLQRLAPDLIITQDLCQVCAVADGEAHRLAQAMDPVPRILSLEARDLAGIWRDIGTVGAAVGRANEARELVANLEDRLQRLADDSPPDRPRVVCIEWLDPLYLAGHWVPEMVAIAGGRDVGATPGSHSVPGSWQDVIHLAPDCVIIMLCGFGIERALKELGSLADDHPLANLPCPIWVLDGNAFTSRPGPRVVDGTALIQSALKGIERPNLVRVASS
jgi:iron complex transport system substrate-binding protein